MQYHNEKFILENIIMNQTIFLEKLNAVGVNTEKAIERFMGNTDLFLRFIQRLPESMDFAKMNEALLNEDEESFYMQVHTLKGTAGNLGVENVCECAQALLVEFRASQFKNRKKLTELLKEAETESEKLSELLSSYASEKKGENV